MQIVELVGVVRSQEDLAGGNLSRCRIGSYERFRVLADPVVSGDHLLGRLLVGRAVVEDVVLFAVQIPDGLEEFL